MNNLRELAFRVDPVLWVREVLGEEPAPWQEELLRAPRGASILALTARQSGKTTAAAWAMAHAAVFMPRSLSVGRLPRATPECRSGSSGVRDAVKSRRQTH